MRYKFVSGKGGLLWGSVKHYLTLMNKLKKGWMMNAYFR